MSIWEKKSGRKIRSNLSGKGMAMRRGETSSRPMPSEPMPSEPMNAKYGKKGSDYRAGTSIPTRDVTDIIKVIDNNMPGMREPYIQGIQHGRFSEVESIKEDLGIESDYHNKMRAFAEDYKSGASNIHPLARMRRGKK